MTWLVNEGDCLDPVSGLARLADRSVDHVITDPPYSRNLYLRFRTNKGIRGSEKRETPNRLALANLQIGAVEDVIGGVGPHLVRLARRWIVIFHDAESGHLWREVLGDLYVRTGVWVKPNGVPQISGDRPAQGCEFITIGHARGRKRWNGGGRPAVWTYNAVNANPNARGDNNHPCPKPLGLMEALVRDFTDPGETILDPFAGSCTTLVAAKRLGRSAIGWERDPAYAAVGRKRVEATREQFDLLAQRTIKPKQSALNLEGA